MGAFHIQGFQKNNEKKNGSARKQVTQRETFAVYVHPSIHFKYPFSLHSGLGELVVPIPAVVGLAASERNILLSLYCELKLCILSFSHCGNH